MKTLQLRPLLPQPLLPHGAHVVKTLLRLSSPQPLLPHGAHVVKTLRLAAHLPAAAAVLLLSLSLLPQVEPVEAAKPLPHHLLTLHLSAALSIRHAKDRLLLLLLLLRCQKLQHFQNQAR